MKKTKKYTIILIMCLLLILPMSVTANEEQTEKENIFVTIGGEPFGIKMFTDGVYILKTESFINLNGFTCCPAEDAGLKCNDIIKKADNIPITSNEDLKNVIEKSHGKEIPLSVERNNEILTMNIKPQLSKEDNYKTGMWIKDSAAGLGTISFYSEELGGYCGLGHGMCDSETNELIPVSTGEANFANVTTITKSSNGNVGTLNGYFTNDKIGNFIINSESGIYGRLTTEIHKDSKIQITPKEDVTKGSAKLYTTINGGTPQYYDISIIMIRKANEKVNLIVKITDDRLLNSTGGIVQGMSGSPIIQDGKLAGILTHVVVNNVDYGYAIFAETMYEQLREAC